MEQQTDNTHHFSYWFFPLGIFIAIMLIATAVFIFTGGSDGKPSVTKKDSTTSTFLYYRTLDANKYNFYRHHPDTSQSDTLVWELEGNYQINDNSFNNGVVLATQRQGERPTTTSRLLALDVEEQKITELASVSSPRRIHSQSVLNDGTIAYVTAAGRASAEESRLHLLNRDTGGETRTFELTAESPLYAGFSVVGENEEQNYLLLREAGGDARTAWTTYYKLDLENGELTPTHSETYTSHSGLPFEEEHIAPPVSGTVNPDGSRLAYARYTTTFDRENFEERDGALCYTRDLHPDAGEAIFLRDALSTTTDEQMIVRNLMHERNVCKHEGRKFISMAWRDADTLVFSTVGGIYQLSFSELGPSEMPVTISGNTLGVLQPENAELLYRFPPSHSSPASIERPRITNISDERIFLSDNTYVNINTQKRLEIPAWIEADGEVRRARPVFLTQ